MYSIKKSVQIMTNKWQKKTQIIGKTESAFLI